MASLYTTRYGLSASIAPHNLAVLYPRSAAESRYYYNEYDLLVTLPGPLCLAPIAFMIGVARPIGSAHGNVWPPLAPRRNRAIPIVRPEAPVTAPISIPATSKASSSTSSTSLTSLASAAVTAPSTSAASVNTDIEALWNASGDGVSTAHSHRGLFRHGHTGWYFMTESKNEDGQYNGLIADPHHNLWFLGL